MGGVARVQGGYIGIGARILNNSQLVDDVDKEGVCLVFLNLKDTEINTQVRPNFVMYDDKMRMDLNIEGDEMFADREVPPEQPPAWTIK